ncbi:MAG TPA: aminoacyl-tRNA hydrolase [Oligoflexia bacterium]|nr:aminoacyl-tRNA hydrolase [Oligoflexia bacterium]HMP47944.1 aminoacyl-tRNA hydrolase [Oligoflexia bacterium]
MLIVGLGNPGREYEDTRHNAGFKVVEKFVSSTSNKYSSDWLIEKKFGCRLASIGFGLCDRSDLQSRIFEAKVIQPLLFMNKSGGPTRKVFDYYKDFFKKNFPPFLSSIKRSESQRCRESESAYDMLPLVVIYDELDFDPGVVRLKLSGSSGGHKGVADIIRLLGNDNFFRIRVGIGHPRRATGSADEVAGKIDVSNWVLGKPEGEERKLFLDGISKAEKICRTLLTEGLESATKV